MIERPKCRIADLPLLHRKVIEMILMEFGRQGLFAELHSVKHLGIEESLEHLETLCDVGLIKILMDGEVFFLGVYDPVTDNYLPVGRGPQDEGENP